MVKKFKMMRMVEQVNIDFDKDYIIDWSNVSNETLLVNQYKVFSRALLGCIRRLVELK